MSQLLIDHSLDLKRLRDEGFDIAVRSGYLLVKSVPYVNSRREIRWGMLVSELTTAGDRTTKPSTHVVYFAGEHPCRTDGSEIAQIKHSTNRQELGQELVVDYQFSSKPTEGYRDYYEKITTYVAIISSQAQAIDSDVTAQTFPVIETDEDGSVFKYLDTASSRADITLVTEKLELRRVAIVGLGGTGSYVLDLVAKTPVGAIHIFDGDKLLSHNAFRSPGAPSVDELRAEPKKADYFGEIYSKMHWHIVRHPYFVNAANVHELEGMDFVFLCLDRGAARRMIVERLETAGTPFIDVGMGVQLVDGSLLGALRVTTSTPAQRGHVWEKQRVPFSEGAGEDEYSRNIQIADLNALNAGLAVVKWKKLFGYYQDLEQEHFSVYTIDGNILINEDQP